MMKMRNDYECIAYSIKMLCYEEKYEEAKKIYENCVKQGKLPQLYFDKERYAGEKHTMPSYSSQIDISSVLRYNHLKSEYLS